MHAFMIIVYTYSHYQLRSGHQKMPTPTWFWLLFMFFRFWTLKRLSKCHIFMNRHLRRVYGPWTAWLKSLLSWQFSWGSSKKVWRVIRAIKEWLSPSRLQAGLGAKGLNDLIKIFKFDFCWVWGSFWGVKLTKTLFRGWKSGKKYF